MQDPLPLDFEPRPADLVRFLEKVSVRAATGCWVWTGHTDGDGYGQFRYGKRAHWAHRWSYAAFRRPLIGGLTVEHKCRNTSCVNPWHLELVTHSENVANGNRHRNGEADEEEYDYDF